MRLFNELALEFGVGTLSCRPSASAVTELWRSVCEEALPQHMEKLAEARAMWLDHHGTGQLPEDLMPDSGTAPSQLDIGELLEGHRMVTDPKDAGRPQAKLFRLKSKAFLLTFNSKDFCGTETLWSTFRDWINGQVKRTHAIQWSAAMESSSHSTRTGTVHLHAYFSWTGKQNKGVNVRGLDEWCFQGVRPRVDCNSEARGPIFWLKAVQRGHFYCSAHKEGALFSATNYPPWTGVWVPETAWVVSLYRQHKLGHDRYLSLSAMLRDGHDRRQASVAAVKITEVAEAFQAERAWAREQILKRSLPFKPLPASIENWMMSYAEIGERYRMLVLFGPPALERHDWPGPCSARAGRLSSMCSTPSTRTCTGFDATTTSLWSWTKLPSLPSSRRTRNCFRPTWMELFLASRRPSCTPTRSSCGECQSF